MSSTVARLVLAGALLAACPAVPAAVAQTWPATEWGRVERPRAPAADSVARGSDPPRFVSRADSLAWDAARARAARARGFRLVISLHDRLLWAIVGDDTVLTARVAVGTDSVLEYQGKRWAFRTPRGVRTVLRKDSLPVWVPPEWHYYEVARRHGLVVRALTRERPVVLEDGRRLVVRGDVVGVVGPDSTFAALPADEEIILGGAVFIPPLGTRNRRIAGELGRYRLDLGHGYMLHGTPRAESIGHAATHGCIRLRDADVAWLYELVPVGTRVHVY